jgi:hypothetical protein
VLAPNASELQSTGPGDPANSSTGQPSADSIRAKDDGSPYHDTSPSLLMPDKEPESRVVRQTKDPAASGGSLLTLPAEPSDKPAQGVKSPLEKTGQDSSTKGPVLFYPAGSKVPDLIPTSCNPPVSPQRIEFTQTKPPEPPEAPEEALLAALRYFLDNKADKAVEVLKKYDKANQDLLLRLLPVLVEMTHNLREAQPNVFTQLADNLERAREPLVPRAELLIDNMAYCERIQDFGRYVPLEQVHVFHPSTHERPGDLVQVYVEVTNLSSVQRPGSRCFETRVESTVDIRAVNDKHLGWHYDFNDKTRVIVSQTQRHDFYNNYSFYVPNIPAGRYILTIHITDCITRRKTQRSLPFVVSTPSCARLASAQ